MIIHAMPSGYDPATDAALNLWLDPSDGSTSSLQKAGGGAVSNGDTVATWLSKKGPARSFTQWGSNALPTYVTNAINGLAAIRFQTQLITTQTSISAFDGISGVTLMRVIRRTASGGAAINLTCLDPNTGFSDITQWGQSGNSYFMNGWRRPQIDTFQSFSGNAVPASNLFISTSVWDFSNAQVSLYQSGVQGPVFATSFGSAGLSAGTSYALSVGGFAQETGHSNGSPSTDGYCGETLCWLSAMSALQLVPMHHYLRVKWGIN